MIEISNRERRSARVPASVSEVHGVLSVVPDSASHFPDVESLIEEHGGYTWTLKKVGLGPISIQTVYCCTYENSLDEGHVTWRAVPGVGNARVEGRWAFHSEGGQTTIEVDTELVMELDVPRLMKRQAEALVRHLNGQMVEQYVANLVRTFSGGDGRVSLRGR